MVFKKPFIHLLYLVDFLHVFVARFAANEI